MLAVLFASDDPRTSWFFHCLRQRKPQLIKDDVQTLTKPLWSVFLELGLWRCDRAMCEKRQNLHAKRLRLEMICNCCLHLLVCEVLQCGEARSHVFWRFFVRGHDDVAQRQDPARQVRRRRYLRGLVAQW